jgi:hypothetical protein
MNSIESDFLKVMTAIDNKKRKQYMLPDERQKLAATELAGKVLRFETWRKQNIKCTKTSSYWLQTKCFKTYSDLYSY